MNHITIKRIAIGAALVAALALAPTWSLASDTGRKAGGVVEESVKTGGRAVRDGAVTFGRTVRDFFTGGARKAGQTWDENAARTKENAREGGRRVEGEANR